MNTFTAVPEADRVVGVRVWMRAERRDDRTVLVLRERLTSVNLRRSATVAFPNGRRGRVRLLGFDDVTIAVPLGADMSVVPLSLEWWPAIVSGSSSRSPRMPVELALALASAGVDADLFAGSVLGRHAVQWVRSAEPGRVRCGRVALVVDAAVAGDSVERKRGEEW